ncbi:unnamed protein product [Nesidiocoris tenuis]|uniref:Uncharacterized protein n=1 Tax=Nesidiocoris tenuis TaxID=355587 RepID=A0A6H5GR70_9HEMI|nr:unnamed protein product [Nesidiocoris tenuis]
MVYYRINQNGGARRTSMEVSRVQYESRHAFILKMIWTQDLDHVATIDAHPVNVYSLAVLGDTLYSCSNDGTLKAWNWGTWDLKKTILEKQQNDIIKVYTDDDKLYASNDQGERWWLEGRSTKGSNHAIHGPHAALRVSQFDVQRAPRYTYMSRGAMIGRFPIRRVGQYVCFLDRSARNIFVHMTSKEDKFKRVYHIKITIIVDFPPGPRHDDIRNGGAPRPGTHHGVGRVRPHHQSLGPEHVEKHWTHRRRRLHQRHLRRRKRTSLHFIQRRLPRTSRLHFPLIFPDGDCISGNCVGKTIYRSGTRAGFTRVGTPTGASEPAPVDRTSRGASSNPIDWRQLTRFS